MAARTANEVRARGKGRPFTKGGDPRRNRKGRPIGARDRVLALREAILDIVEGPWSKQERRAYLKVLAQKYPARFVALIAKILPTEVETKAAAEIRFLHPDLTRPGRAAAEAAVLAMQAALDRAEAAPDDDDDDTPPGASRQN